MSLDKPRIYLDFNELCDVDQESEAPIYLFSQGDIVNDSDGKDVELYDGMRVSVFDDDLDWSNMPDAMLAEGVILKNYLPQYPRVKWLIRLIEHAEGGQSGKRYVYWMSDLQRAED